MSEEITIKIVQDMKWYVTYMVKKGESVGKIHIPTFDNGDILVRLYDEGEMIKKIADCPEWFKYQYLEILYAHRTQNK